MSRGLLPVSALATTGRRACVGGFRGCIPVADSLLKDAPLGYRVPMPDHGTQTTLLARSARRNAASQISTSYLGFPLLISDQSVTVRTPDGRRLGVEVSMAKARLLVRGYRKASKEGS